MAKSFLSGDGVKTPVKRWLDEKYFVHELYKTGNSNPIL
jgi:hypothetical protein